MCFFNTLTFIKASSMICYNTKKRHFNCKIHNEHAVFLLSFTGQRLHEVSKQCIYDVNFEPFGSSLRRKFPECNLEPEVTVQQMLITVLVKKKKKKDEKATMSNRTLMCMQFDT